MIWREETRLEGERVRQLVSAPDGSVYAVGRHLWLRSAVGWTATTTPISGPWRAAAAAGADLWVVGAGGRAIRRTVAGWEAHEIPAARFELVDVIAWPGAAWISAAGSEVWRWTGGDVEVWKPEALARRVVGPMWGATPDDVWIGAPEKRRGAPPELLHWDGTSWTQHPLGDRSGLITSIHGRSASDVWAVGYENKAFGKRPVIAHWDGQCWTHIPAPLTGSVGAVHMGGADVWLLASAGQAFRGGLAGWRPVDAGDHTLTTVYAPAGGPVRAVADGRILLVGEGDDEAGLP